MCSSNSKPCHGGLHLLYQALTAQQESGFLKRKKEDIHHFLTSKPVQMGCQLSICLLQGFPLAKISHFKSTPLQQLREGVMADISRIDLGDSRASWLNLLMYKSLL